MTALLVDMLILFGLSTNSQPSYTNWKYVLGTSLIMIINDSQNKQLLLIGSVLAYTSISPSHVFKLYSTLMMLHQPEISAFCWASTSFTEIKQMYRSCSAHQIKKLFRGLIYRTYMSFFISFVLYSI